MRGLGRVWAALFIAMILAACQGTGDFTLPRVDPPPTAESAPRVEALPEASATLLPVAFVETATPPASYAEPRPTPRTRYSLHAVLDYPHGQLTVTQTILTTNHSSEAWADLVLQVEPDRRPGVFQLNGAAWGDGAPVEGLERQEGQMRIPLPAPLPPGETVELILVYELYLPSRPGTVSFTYRQVNLADWYPCLPPYAPGQGWLAYPPGTAGEHMLYPQADFDVLIQVLDAPPGLVVAASAEGSPETALEGLSYRYWLEAGRSFAWSASPQYHVIEAESQTLYVRAYVYPEHRAAGKAAAEASAKAADLFADLFGPLPRASLAVVEADFVDGMEYQGLYFLSWDYFDEYDGTPRNSLVPLAAHETAHQWWYGQVGNDQALEPWLDEAMCTYSERLFFEHAHPDLVGWWWNFRVNDFAPSGWVDSSIYEHDEGYRPYVNAVYLRGARFLENLRYKMGDEAFFAFLRAYYEQGRLRTLQDANALSTGEEFFALLDATSPVDLTTLKEIYYR